MHARDSTARLRSVVHAVLGQACEGDPIALSPSWARLLGEDGGRPFAGSLSHELYLELRRHFEDNLVLEVPLAQAGMKVSRGTLPDAKIELLRRIGEPQGLYVEAGETAWIVGADRGKGRWANRAERAATQGEAGAVRHVYLAAEATLAEIARMLDEAGEDDLFGALLGIPPCCRAGFERHRAEAAAKQFDLTPCTLRETSIAPPYDWRLNYLAQQFGRSLISFFPCAFDCPAALRVAEEIRSLVLRCDPGWAEEFEVLQKSNVLYTEYDGLHAISAPFAGGMITFAPDDLRHTELTPLASLLRRADRLVVGGKQAVSIWGRTAKLADLSGEDVCMCLFR